MTRPTQQTAPKRTRQPRLVGAGEAADRVLKLRQSKAKDLEEAYLGLVSKWQERQAEKEQRILSRCLDPDRARKILAMYDDGPEET